MDTRLTLKLDESTIKKLKENAKKEGKSLVQFMVDRSIIYEEELIPGLVLRTSFISQKSFEAEIYRVDVDVSEIKYGRYLLVRRYEIWASSESIEDELNIKNSPLLPELAKFAFDVVKKAFENNKDLNGDRELPEAYGFFCDKQVRNTKG